MQDSLDPKGRVSIKSWFARRRLFAISIALVSVVLISSAVYYFFGYEGPGGEFRVLPQGPKFIIIDAQNRPYMVMKEDVQWSPSFLAVRFGKVKKVKVFTEEGYKLGYVWKRCLPEDWDEDF